jgi:hypothetical protein
LVDYHLTRLRLLLDLGVLNTAEERFWLKPGKLPKVREEGTAPPAALSNELVTPQQLFEK